MNLPRTASEFPVTRGERGYAELHLAGPDADLDATRRTRLASERTYLAWWRTGLTSFAVSLGAGKLVPAVSDVREWPFTLLGAGFAVIGLVCVWYGSRRYYELESAIHRGEFPGPDPRLTKGLAAAGIALGLLLLVVVLFS